MPGISAPGLVEGPCVISHQLCKEKQVKHAWHVKSFKGKVLAFRSWESQYVWTSGAATQLGSKQPSSATHLHEVQQHNGAPKIIIGYLYIVSSGLLGTAPQHSCKKGV